MNVAPAITLTANLEDFTGTEIGSAASPASVRIALCGFGPTLPFVPQGAAVTITAITFATPHMTLTGSFPAYSAAWIGQQFTVAGDLVNTGNNGRFPCTGGSTTSLILTNAAGVAEASPSGVTVASEGVMVAKVGPFEIQTQNGSISTPLWGNDVIEPAGTYYSISILDDQENVVQCGAYQFTGSGTQDLSAAPQIVPGTLPGLPYLAYEVCTGSGTGWTAPGTVIAVVYRGLILPAGQSLPELSYTLSGGTGITLNFSPTGGNPIYALCIV